MTEDLSHSLLRSTPQRLFSSTRIINQEPKPKPKPEPNSKPSESPKQEEEEEEAAKPSTESKSDPPSDQQKSEESAKSQSPESESEKSYQKTGEGEGEGEEKTDKKDAPPPPPPPHGDKTPWQVFTETLQTEFAKSKEWNESTKALQSGYQDFTQNPALQKAKSAYEEASKTASTTTSAALKQTGKAIGHSAAWAWDTPVAKVVRKTANVAGTGIEKVTRPVRETEAFQNVKKVIDDGSSSRYGGWTEKEERRARRAARVAEAIKNGESTEPMVEDPK
jgi:import inner membrane translocase subunit TIM44